MSNSDNKCKWHFDKQTGEDQGPGDALGQNFKGEPYAALVRESIQNSLDVPLENGSPVRVVYSFGNIDSDSLEGFFDLKDHIKGCMEFWHAKGDIVAKYQKKLECFDNGLISNMPYLKVSDYNTQGMDYKNGDNNCPFYAFVRASKISVKGGSFQGGTYGFGKAAYFQLSPINTLFISTQTPEGKVFFEGKSALCTHLYKHEKKTSVGFFDNTNGERPIDKVSEIPEMFRRDESGTDFYILGFNPSDMDSALKKMMHEVLRSFHPAVEAGMLEVEIRSTKGIINITKESINDYIIQEFPDELDNSGQYRTLNPRPYYDALVHKGEGKGYEVFEGEKEHLGKVKMFIKKVPGATDKIVFMRRPRMLVYAQKAQSSLGFYGVFICDDKNGDILLSKLENSSHSKWSRDFYRDEITSDCIQEGVDAMNELKEFCDECIAKIAGENPNNELSIPGLEDLLYVPDSLLDDDRQSVLGKPIDNNDEENGSPTTSTEKIDVDNKQKDPLPIGTIMVEAPGKAKSSPTGKTTAGTGHGKGKRQGGKEPAPGVDVDITDIDETKGKHFVPMNVPVRVFAQNIDGTIYHIVIIHSDREVENGKMELIVCGEQYDMQIKVVDTDNGKPKENTITNMAFGNEVVKVRIRFADNMPHTVQTKLYYEE
jgi:hypothetical protein